MAPHTPRRPCHANAAAGEEQTPVQEEQEEIDMNIHVPVPRAPKQDPRATVISRNGERIPGQPRGGAR